MKKIMFIGIMITTLMLNSKVLAFNATPTILCNSESINTQKNVTCTVKANVTEGQIYAFSGDIKLSSNLELVSTNVDSAKWQGGIQNNKIGVYTANGYSGNVDVVSFTLKLKDSNSQDISIGLTDCSFTDENYATVNYNGEVTKLITFSSSTIDDDNDNKEVKEESKKETKKSDNKKSKSNSSSDNKEETTEVLKNPDTGAFLSIITTASLSVLIIFIIINIKKKSFFKRI